MTENKSIEFLKERQAVAENYPEVKEYFNALSVAIKAMEEVQKYREIGTVTRCKLSVEICKAMIERGIEPENVEAYIAFEDKVVQNGFTIKGLLEAAEKQKPKKPIEPDVDYGTSKCPNCNGLIFTEDRFETHKYCLLCGQKLDWSDEE